MDFNPTMDTIAACSARISLLYAEWARAHGLSPHALTVLFALHQAQPCTQKQICEAWLLPKQTVNTVVKGLQKRGWVALIAGRNQKEKLAAFTPSGEAVLSGVLRETRALEDRTLNRMGSDQGAAVADEFRRFAEIFEEEIHGYEQ